MAFYGINGHCIAFTEVRTHGIEKNINVCTVRLSGMIKVASNLILVRKTCILNKMFRMSLHTILCDSHNLSLI